MRKKTDWLLLLIALLSLSLGGLLSIRDHSDLAETIWALGGIAGLIPSLIWIYKSIRHGEMGSDLLALLSIVGTLATKNFLASSIISLMLATGRVLENWAEGQAERQLKALLSRVPRVAHVISQDGVITDISVDDVQIGDRILIKPGEVICADGRVVGIAILDESALTGEPLPVHHSPDDFVCSGVLNAAHNFEMIVAANAAESTYAGIIRLVERAQANSAPAVRLANKWAIKFVPVALGMSALTLLFTHDVGRMVAVLVTATPCPLILAVPIAIVSGMSRSARSGVIVKGGAVLELLAQAEVVMLDKTGTLTHGGPAVESIMCAPLVSSDEIIQLAASIDQFSGHVIAKAIVAEATARSLTILPASDIVEDHGVGISGNIQGSRINVGQFTERPAWLSMTFPLMVGVKSNDNLIGVIGLADPIREEAADVLNQLREVGVSRTFLVTGDRLESAQLVADQVGITDIHASVSAEGKLKLVEQAMKDHKGSVLFVGDGINDAPALSAASVGIAMGARGASAASESADVVIVEDSIAKLVHVIAIAKFSHKRAVQAALLGMGLSLVAMALASIGLLTSTVGAATQEVIDIVAILWALTALGKSDYSSKITA